MDTNDQSQATNSKICGGHLGDERQFPCHWVIHLLMAMQGLSRTTMILYSHDSELGQMPSESQKFGLVSHTVVHSSIGKALVPT